jgi:hypothetical protein
MSAKVTQSPSASLDFGEGDVLTETMLVALPAPVVRVPKVGTSGRALAPATQTAPRRVPSPKVLDYVRQHGKCPSLTPQEWSRNFVSVESKIENEEEADVEIPYWFE